MNSNTVDLIATDPPFKKGRDFHATPDSLAAGARFQDRWSWEKDVHQDWLDSITDGWPAVWEVIDAANAIYMRQTRKNLLKPREEVGSDMGAFLCFMAVRILEMRRILKPTGTIYIHLDYSAVHYVKQLMDAIFGWKMFRNEIIWCYSGGGIPKRDFPRKHDTILRYTKGDEYFYEPVYRDYSKGTVQRGRTQVKGKYYERGLREEGTPTPDWWTGVKKITSPTDPEKTGFKTQKSVDLYSRIIESSSRPGDMVLDPFCGCATTLLSAEMLGRNWVGIDLWDKAHDVILNRFRQEYFEAEGTSGETLPFDRVHYSRSDPERTDEGQVASPHLRVKVKTQPHEPPGPRMTRAQMYKFLLGEYGSKCQGCERIFDDPRYLQLDHNTPRSSGGINHISNRILLCGPCNRLKSDVYTLVGLRRQNRKLGFMADQDIEHPIMREVRQEREGRLF